MKEMPELTIDGRAVTWIGNAGNKADFDRWQAKTQERHLEKVFAVFVSDQIPTCMLGEFATGETFCHRKLEEAMTKLDFWETVPDPETN